MKIAIFLQDLNSGGAEKIMVNFANYLAENDEDEVYLIVVRNMGPYKKLIDNKVRLIDLNSKKTSLSLLPLVIALKKYRIDTLYSTLVNANVLSLIAGKIVGVNVIIREANTISSNRKNEKRLLIKSAHFFSKHVYSWCYKCISISNSVKADLLEYTNCEDSQVKVIYNPIIPIDTCNNVQLDSNKFHIGIVSRLTVQKNIETIKEIAKEIVQRNKNIVFHFFGEGDSKNLEDLIKELNAENNILLHGFNISYLSYVKKMNVFIHIPYWEGLGNSVLEVFNSGIPMILSNVKSGFSELIHPSYPNVHYFSPTDKEGMVNTVYEYYHKNIPIESNREKLNLSSNETYKKYRSLAS